VNAPIERVQFTPESLWETENKTKHNKFARLNDTCHIIFRILSSPGSMFDFNGHPVLWDEWKNDLLPVMGQAEKGLGNQNYRFSRAMFA